MPRWTEEIGAFAMDRQGKVTLASPLALAIAGIELEELVKQHYLDYFGPSDAPDAQALFEKALAGETIAGHKSIVRADGSEIKVGFTAQPDRHAGEIVGITGTVWTET